MSNKTEAPTDDLATVGGYRHKEKLSQLLVDYRDAFYMIALVHEQGTYKYDCYSWLTNPNASNSTILENIDALFRHMGAHTMGRIMDPEGLPHIFHMACRAGMLVSTFHRAKFPIEKRFKPYRTTDFEKTHVEICSHSGWQITPEEIYALTLRNHTYTDAFDSPEQILPAINSLLLDIVLKAHSQAKAVLTKKGLEDDSSLIRQEMEDILEKEPDSFGQYNPKPSSIDIIFQLILDACQMIWKSNRDTIYKPLMTDRNKIIRTLQMEFMLHELGIDFSEEEKE